VVDRHLVVAELTGAVPHVAPRRGRLITDCGGAVRLDGYVLAVVGVALVVTRLGSARTAAFSGQSRRRRRTLDPRVRGSSPWRRTRTKLGVLEDIENAQLPLWSGFAP
jgi:hypothetical protein